MARANLTEDGLAGGVMRPVVGACRYVYQAIFAALGVCQVREEGHGKTICSHARTGSGSAVQGDAEGRVGSEGQFSE